MKSIRVWYKKTGRLKYISHLDMNRVMTRIIRRSKLPIWFTEGFNPHPYINFALPLSLGFESECEAVDMRVLDDEMRFDEILNRLAENMPDGLTVTEVCEPQYKFKHIAFARFDIVLRSMDKSAYDIERFLSQDNIFCDKKTKRGGTKQIDLKEKIKSYTLDVNENGDFLLSLILPAGTDDNINPMLVVDSLNNTENNAFSVLLVVRRSLLDAEMKIFR